MRLSPRNIAQTAAHAAKRGATLIAFALAWALRNRVVSAVIAGPRTEAHWDTDAEGLKTKLGPQNEKLVDSLGPSGHASTPGCMDPGYPVGGRQTV
jgi:aryl-alcohol dehydrogenase-like predicted oxidoreductase